MDGHMLSYCINFYPENCSYLSSIYLSYLSCPSFQKKNLSYLHPVILFALSLSNPPSSKRSLPFPVVPRCRHSLLSDSLSLLPCSSFTGGDDWASGGAICHVFAQPFAGDEHPPGMPAPLLFPSAVRDGAPQTLTKLICIRI